MKRVWLVVALVALGGLASSTFADVQNIRLSGDIRLRGYFLERAGADSGGDQVSGGAAFISQRTRISVEGDLEDHVLVVVTLKAEGLWGAENAVANQSGAGTGPAGGDPHLDFPSDTKINRQWGIGLTEAYVQLNEVFYTPATIKLGRQYLHYGHGLILSSVEQEYNYDVGRVVLDYYPLTIDLVGGMIDNDQGFTATPGHNEAADILFVNARYEMTDSIIKNVEAYVGWVAQAASGLESDTHFPPVAGGSSPWIIGLRTDLVPVEGLSVWLEGTYEGGADGFTGNGTISAWLLNAGAKFVFKDVMWSPSVNANFIYAGAGGRSGRHQFRPWFDYADGYNGYVFAPALSNIEVFNIGASAKPYENTTVALQAYYYRSVDRDSPAGSNGNVDFGGPSFTAFGFQKGPSHDLGWEVDGIVGYDYSKDVRLQLVYGVFVPLHAYNVDPSTGAVVQEVRGEVNVKF